MSTESINSLPEARTSASFKVKDPQGFEHIFTIRNNVVMDLMNEITIVGKKMIDLGWTPIAQGYNRPTASQPEKVAPMCGVHGNPMMWKEGTSKTTGKPYAFWACGTKNADGSYCNYKAPKA